MNFISILQEMAAAHMDQEVGDLMARGEVEEAVKKYIYNMVKKKAKIARTSTAVTNKIREKRVPKALKIDPETLKKIPEHKWDAFDKAYERIVKEYQDKKSLDLSTKIKGHAVKTKEGEEVGITSGHTQNLIKQDLVKTIAKAKIEADKKLADATSDAERERIKENLAGLEILYNSFRETFKGRGVLDADPKKLKQRYNRIQTQAELMRDPELLKQEIENLKKALDKDKTSAGRANIRKKIERLENAKSKLKEDFEELTNLLQEEVSKDKITAIIQNSFDKAKSKMDKEPEITVKEFEKLFDFAINEYSNQLESQKGIIPREAIIIAKQQISNLKKLRDNAERVVIADPEIAKDIYDQVAKIFNYKKESVEEHQEEINEELTDKQFDELISLAIKKYEKLLQITTDEKEKKVAQEGIDRLKKIKRNTIKEQKVFIPYSTKMYLIMEGIHYQGTHFSENYLFSNFVKAFYQDKQKYGIELTEELYKEIYGEDIEILTSCLKEHEEFVNKAGESKQALLFEGYAVDAELSEGVWDVIKKFGGASIGKLQRFLGKGVDWAKELVSKGTAFFTELPIAQIAVPAIAITGGVIAAVKLINKIRRKAGKNPLSKEEKEKFKETLKANKEEVADYIK